MQNSIGSNVETLYQILDNQAEALEFSIREDGPVVGVPLMDLALKKNLLVACINHNGRIIIPRGHDQIQVGDTVIIVTTEKGLQDINDIPGELPAGRTKPWGTGQAVLAAKDVIKTPFIVINADDYYGKEGFKAVHEYLVNGGKSCMAGFVLKNTLSDNGGVTRGICKMDEDNNLTEVVETKNIVKTADGAEADGVAVDVNSLVSMNMWGLTPDFLDVLEKGFKEFFEKEVPGNPQKAEYLIPIFIGELLEQGKMSVKVLKTNDTWYGMTYHEDVAAVKGSFKEMLENGVYKADLFSDL